MYYHRLSLNFGEDIIMAFWDDLQKGVSNAASFTAKKTTELTDLARLKYNIYTEETKLERCFTEIGRLFYSSERDGADASAEITSYIMQADKISADIRTYRQELAHLRRVCICPSCGAEVSNECSFCPSCGTKLECDAECDCDVSDCADTDDTSCDEGESGSSCGCGCCAPSKHDDCDDEN